MSAGWRALRDEICRWQDAGNLVKFWWRDDDARQSSAALSRLLDLAQQSTVPLALAVIPRGAQAKAFDHLPKNVAVLQHGVDHINRAAPGQKKTEFPAAEPESLALERLWLGWQELRQIVGEQALPVLAPPWNRFTQDRVLQLAARGYRGLSAFQSRPQSHPAPGLVQVNTHVDITEWRPARRFVGEDQAFFLAFEQLRMRRCGECDTSEPIGWLTHHAVHEEPAWQFLAALFERTQTLSGLHWMHPAEVFEVARS